MESVDNKKIRNGKSRKYYVLLGLFILTIAVVHFAMQLTFIQKENLRSVETAVETQEVDEAPPVEQYIEIEPEQYEVKKIEIITIPEKVKPAPRVQKAPVFAAPTAPAVRKIAKKKDSGETRAERLRRAERLLTGI